MLTVNNCFVVYTGLPTLSCNKFQIRDYFCSLCAVVASAVLLALFMLLITFVYLWERESNPCRGILYYQHHYVMVTPVRQHFNRKVQKRIKKHTLKNSILQICSHWFYECVHLLCHFTWSKLNTKFATQEHMISEQSMQAHHNSQYNFFWKPQHCNVIMTNL